MRQFNYSSHEWIQLNALMHGVTLLPNGFIIILHYVSQRWVPKSNMTPDSSTLPNYVHETKLFDE